MSSSEILTALATVGARREELDRAEWLLVAAARRDGATWAEVATALGVRSRQAAEQRWQRLRGAIGVAAEAGPVRLEREDVTRLRRRVALAYDLLVQVPIGPRAAPATRLARSTLALAGPAPAGALHDLVRLAIDDLGRAPTGSLGPDLERAGQRLREALDASSTATIG